MSHSEHFEIEGSKSICVCVPFCASMGEILVLTKESVRHTSSECVLSSDVKRISKRSQSDHLR